MRFSEFFNQVILKEATFRKSKYVEHLADFPMFSVFVSKNILEKPNTPYNMEFFKDIKDEIAETCADARNQITKIGFPTMHVNVVIGDLAVEDNNPSAAGLAFGNRQKGYNKGYNKPGHHWKNNTRRKYMKIDLKALLRFNDFTTSVLVHEWAHVWMFNNSKQFKNTVEKLYTHLLNKSRNNLNYQEPKQRVFGDNLLNSKDDDDLFSFIITSAAKIFKDNYQWTIVSLQTPDDTDFKFGEKEIQKYVEKDFRKLVTNCVKFYNDRSKNYKISIQEHGTQLSDLAKDLYETVGAELLKAIDKSITNDRFDFDPEYHENPPDDILEYILQNATKTNEKFRTKGKSYNDLYTNVEDVDGNLVIIDKIFDTLWDISRKEKEKENRYELDTISSLTGERWDTVRDQVAKLVKWSRAYGMTNDDELWATGIEEFFKLPLEHRKSIIKLMEQNR
jgi:hypothetical protein